MKCIDHIALSSIIAKNANNGKSVIGLSRIQPNAHIHQITVRDLRKLRTINNRTVNLNNTQIDAMINLPGDRIKLVRRFCRICSSKRNSNCRYNKKEGNHAA